MDQLNSNLLQGIDTVIVRVTDIEISKKWYREKLNLDSLWDDPNMKLVVFNTNGPTSLTLWQTTEKVSVNKTTASYPIFKTPDAFVLREELQKRNIPVDEIIEDDHVKYFFFFDPDGNVLEACQVH